MTRTVAIAATVIAMLSPALPAGADPIPPLLPTGSPSPSPSPSAKPQPKGTPKPNAKPPSSTKPRQPKGPAPDVYEGPIEDALAYWRSLPKTPSRTTQPLLDLLQRLQPPGAPLDQAAVVRGVGRFPVAGYTSYQDDWAAPRYLPYFHMHEGNDLFARDGTPVVACANGVISKLMVGTIGGVSIWLRADGGTVYYYGHLRAYASGIRAGLRVRAGQVLATVGNTGTAVTTPPHVHFEVHPAGGRPVNPKPSLDTWLAEAEARAAAALRQNAALLASARIGAARWNDVFGLLAQPAPEPAPYWNVALDPAAGPGPVDLALDRIAISIDWSDVAPGVEAAQPHEDVASGSYDASLFASPPRAVSFGG